MFEDGTIEGACFFVRAPWLCLLTSKGGFDVMRPESIPGEQTYRGAVRWARRQLQGLKQLRQQPGLLELLLLLPLHRCSGSEEG